MNEADITKKLVFARMAEAEANGHPLSYDTIKAIIENDTVSADSVEFETGHKEISEETNRLRKLLNMSVNEIELSVRAANCLNNANINTVGELAMKTEQEMLKYRNFGKKSLNEIKAKLEQLGLSLGQKINEGLLDKGVNA